MYVVINICIERITYTVYRRKENAHVLCGIAVLLTGGCIISSTLCSYACVYVYASVFIQHALYAEEKRKAHVQFGIAVLTMLLGANICMKMCVVIHVCTHRNTQHTWVGGKRARMYLVCLSGGWCSLSPHNNLTSHYLCRCSCLGLTHLLPYTS